MAGPVRLQRLGGVGVFGGAGQAGKVWRGWLLWRDDQGWQAIKKLGGLARANKADGFWKAGGTGQDKTGQERKGWRIQDRKPMADLNENKRHGPEGKGRRKSQIERLAEVSN